MSAARADIRAAEFKRSYRAAFDAYLLAPDERTLHAAYELGREAVARGLGLVDVASIHHDVVQAALAEFLPAQAEGVVGLAGDFLVEALSAFEMVQRAYREATERGVVEQRHAAMLRRLSTLLSDTSLAAGAADSLGEALQLVAEQARELTGAGTCSMRTRLGGRGGWVTAVADEEGPDSATDFADGPRLSVPLVSLAGEEIGLLEVAKRGGRFSVLDEAILVHLGQMAAATIERIRI